MKTRASRAGTFAIALVPFLAGAAWSVSGCGGIVAPLDPNADGGSLGSTTTGSSGSSGKGGSGNGSKMSGVGGACTSAVDCLNSDGTDGGLSCAASHENIPFPAGDCTGFCQETSDCPGQVGTVVCGASPYDLGQSASCMLSCSSDSDCRAGYTCLAVMLPDGTTGQGCWSRPAH